MPSAFGNGSATKNITKYEFASFDDPGCSILLLPSPVTADINFRLPSTHNLRILSCLFEAQTTVLATAGRSFEVITNYLKEKQFDKLIVEIDPHDHETALKFLLEIILQYPEIQIFVLSASPNFKDQLARLAEHRSRITFFDKNPTSLFVKETKFNTAVKTAYSKQEKLQYWERRRILPALGCPSTCSHCSRNGYDCELTGARTIHDIWDEIEDRVSIYGTRDVDVLGTSWAVNRDFALEFLFERLRRDLDVRLNLRCTIEQLSAEIIRALAIAHCSNLYIRQGSAMTEIRRDISRELRHYSKKGTISIITGLNPDLEDPLDASLRVANLVQQTHADYVYLTLESTKVLPPSCSDPFPRLGTTRFQLQVEPNFFPEGWLTKFVSYLQV